MRASIILPLLALGLSACATLPATQRTPFLPASVYGALQDNDTGAISLAAWAFASPANTRGDPADAAKAVIALEYLSGELKENPRWVEVDSSVAVHLAQARNQLRQILGIRPDAPPQVVVNVLLAFATNVQTGNQAAAMQALASPLFTTPPEQTLQALANLPYVQEANLATARAQEQILPGGGVRG
jgi:hypothetical protein